jgi:valyl-tRNA synthetase
LHPFMPFVSEEIWQVIRPYLDESNLAAHLPIAKYPEASATNPLSALEQTAMNHCIEATEAINSQRAFLRYAPGERVRVVIKPFIPPPGVVVSEARSDRERIGKEFETWRAYAAVMTRSDISMVFQDNPESRKGLLASVIDWGEVLVAIPTGFDLEKARTALQKKLAEVQVHFEKDASRLNDIEFLKKASSEIRITIQDRHGELLNQLHLLDKQLKQLEAAG